MKLLFRVDASRQIGGGHVMRCLTLAHGAKQRGHDVTFATRALAGNMDTLIAESFALTTLPAPTQPFAAQKADPAHAHWAQISWQEDAEQTRALIVDTEPDWLILDHYGFDARWVKYVGANRTMVIDDLADRPLAADLLLDQTRLTPASYPASVRRKLSGPAYTLLRPEFARAPTQTKGAKPRVLIAPGLMDSYNLTDLALEALTGLKVEIDLATGEDAPALPQLRKACPDNLTLHTPATDMANLINRATFAIAAGGMSAWERCALGLPSIIISVAENQTHVCESLAEAGACIHISGAPRPSATSLRNACEHLLQNPQTLADMSRKANALCDGQGTGRVLDVLEAKLRNLQPHDEELIFQWRDQSHIRAASLNSAPLDRVKHGEWFEKARAHKDALYRIYQEGAHDLGFVFAQSSEAGWFWSFYIGSQNAPKGAGRRMLVSFLDLFFAQTPQTHLKAKVLANNPASMHLHQTLGFTQDASDATSEMTLTLSRQDWERSKSP